MIKILNRKLIAIIVAGALLLGAFFLFTQKVEATGKVYICHFDGKSGNFQTLHIARKAARAHLRNHDRDYEGECKPEPTTRMCHWDGDSFEAIAVTKTARARHFNAHKLDKDWETGMDKYCEFDDPEPEPKDDPKTFKEDTRCHDNTPPELTWLEITDGSADNNWFPQASWSAMGGSTIEVRFSDDPDNLRWRFEMDNDGRYALRR